MREERLTNNWVTPPVTLANRKAEAKIDQRNRHWLRHWVTRQIAHLFLQEFGRQTTDYLLRTVIPVTVEISDHQLAIIA